MSAHTYAEQPAEVVRILTVIADDAIAGHTAAFGPHGGGTDPECLSCSVVRLSAKLIDRLPGIDGGETVLTPVATFDLLNSLTSIALEAHQADPAFRIKPGADCPHLQWECDCLCHIDDALGHDFPGVDPRDHGNCLPCGHLDEALILRLELSDVLARDSALRLDHSDF
jgi:hypothetical protein